MLDNERQIKIIEILEKEKKVTVNDLVKTLFASPATIRRDLSEMANRGLLKRIHGGAILYASSSQESSILIRENSNKDEKLMVCAKAVEYIKNNQSIFLDSSSTVANLVEYLNERKYLTIITTGLSCASLLTQKTPFTIYIPGGFIQSQSNSITGSTVIESLQKLHTDVFVFSCSGLSLDGVISEATIEQSEIKKTMANNSATRILLVDSSKIGKKYLAESVNLKDVDILITDKKLDLKLQEVLMDNKVQIVICN